MSFNDQKSFLKSIHPFDELSDELLEYTVERIEIQYFKAGSSVNVCGDDMEHFYIIIKGEVKVMDEKDEIVRVYREKDSFDADALIEGGCDYTYTVTEDLIAYTLDKKSFMKLFEECSRFKEFYLMDIIERIDYLKKRERDSGEWMTAKVSDTICHTPCIVSEDTKLIDALKKSVNMNRSEIVIESADRGYGVITDSDIKRIVSLGELNATESVGRIGHFPMLTVDRDDFIFNAYLLLIKENVKRLGVTENGVLTGILEQIDILSYFANHSHLITVKIDKANTLDELKDASLGYITIVKRLYSQGLKSRYISKLISEINRKVFAKLFEIVIPEEMKGDCSLLVMGSEGRGEQIVRTDQDNALIVKDDIEPETYLPYMEKFSSALIEFGYPPCPGNVMVTNSYWRRTLSGYKREIDKWIESPDEESFMNFSIFFDAEAVAGDKNMIKELKRYIFSRFDGRNDIYMAFFAKSALMFETPVGIWSAILHRDREIDIKKAGIFPIVQGVRALSLKYKVVELSTVERIKKLVDISIIDESFARELVEAFDTLSFIRLGVQLDAINEGKEANNIVRSDKMSKIQRDLLRDSLEIVERFKRFIMSSFNLDMLPS